MTVIMEWQFPLKVVWMAQDPLWEIIDLDKGRIDTFVAFGRVSTTRPCRAYIVRSDNFRNVEVKCDPPDIRWAYSQWLGSERTIVGDVDLWHRTFDQMLSGATD